MALMLPVMSLNVDLGKDVKLHSILHTTDLGKSIDNDSKRH